MTRCKQHSDKYSIPAVHMDTGYTTYIKLKEFSPCKQPEILDNEQFNTLVKHGGTVYAINSIDVNFK